MTDRPPSPRASAIRRLPIRLRRRILWLRQRRGLLGEDKLEPTARVHAAVARWRWRRSNGEPGRAVPVWVVGVQRSGTNMLVRGFHVSPEFEVHNEDDRRAFRRFRLRSDETIRTLIAGSPHRYVLFKPLCDSHRVDELLDRFSSPTPGRAIWIYRSVEGRVRSAVQTFGPSNLIMLRHIANGRALDSWQAAGLSGSSLELIRRFDRTGMSPESAAALFWYVRNSIYFEHGLHDRPDVMLVSYDAFLHDPVGTMRPLCSFLDFPYTERLVEHISSRSRSRPVPLDIDPGISRLCADLQERMDAASREKARRQAGV